MTIADLHVAVTLAAAVAAVWAMQRLTYEAGFASGRALAFLLMRFGLAALAMLLFIDVGLDRHDPTAIDVAVRGAYLFLLIVSGAQHRRRDGVRGVA